MPCTGAGDRAFCQWLTLLRRPGDGGRSSKTLAAPRRCARWRTSAEERRSERVASSACCDLAEKLMAERWPRAAKTAPAWNDHFPAINFSARSQQADDATRSERRSSADVRHLAHRRGAASVFDERPPSPGRRSRVNHWQNARSPAPVHGMVPRRLCQKYSDQKSELGFALAV